LKQTTRDKIREEVVNFGKASLATQYSIEDLKKAFPFHAVFFSDEGLRAFKEQRSLVTKMGLQLYPAIALYIARDKYSDAHPNYLIEGKADTGMISTADRVLDDLRTGRRKPNLELELKEIQGRTSGKTSAYRVIADLYIVDYKPGPLFMEIKSPRPNLDVCAESKKKMWYFRIMNEGKNPQAYLGFPYNPFVRRERYNHAFTKQIMDMDKEVLLGEDMWNKLGGSGTYDELLEILEEAKSEPKKEIQTKPH